MLHTPKVEKGVATLALAPGTYVVIINNEATDARAETIATVRSGQTTQLGTMRLK